MAAALIALPLDKMLAKELATELADGDREAGAPFLKDFSTVNDRTWIGQDFWAVPMEDWEVRGGRLLFTGQEKRSRLHLLTYTIGKGEGDFSITCNMGMNASKVKGAVGFCVAITNDTDPGVRSCCYYGQGISAGIQSPTVNYTLMA